MLQCEKNVLKTTTKSTRFKVSIHKCNQRHKSECNNTARVRIRVAVFTVRRDVGLPDSFDKLSRLCRNWSTHRQSKQLCECYTIFTRYQRIKLRDISGKIAHDNEQCVETDLVDPSTKHRALSLFYVMVTKLNPVNAITLKITRFAKINLNLTIMQALQPVEDWGRDPLFSVSFSA